VPGHAERIGKELKLLRVARKWSQERLIVELERTAMVHGGRLPTRSSMRTLVSNWENGRRLPAAEHRPLLAGVHGVCEEDLFAPDPADDLQLSVDADVALPSSTAGAELAGYLRAVLAEHSRADRLLGPRHVLQVVTAQLGSIEGACKQARGRARDELLDVGARYAEFAGWLYQDTGNPLLAQRWSSHALDYAHELGNPHLVSYVFMRRSNIATEAGDGPTGLGLATAALRNANQLTPGLRAVALRQVAHAHALAGDAAACAHAVEQAQLEANALGEDDGITGYCTPAYVDMEAGNAWMHLDRPDRAVPLYQSGLHRWPAGQERDRGLCLSRLAAAHAEAGDVDQAAETGQRAAAVVRTAPSARAIAELRRTRLRLSPYRHCPDVAELEAVLTGVA
jgi:transcriptional regulator with XRE-family HTH domain